MGLRGPLPGSGALSRDVILAIRRGARTEAQLFAVITSMNRRTLRTLLWRMTVKQHLLEAKADPHTGVLSYSIKEGAAIDSTPQYRYAHGPDPRAADRATRSLADAFSNIVALRTATP